MKRSSFRELHNLCSSPSKDQQQKITAGFVLLLGDWQTPPELDWKTLVAEAFVGIHEQQRLQSFSASVVIHDDDLEFALKHLRIPRALSQFPSELPAVALVYQNCRMEYSEWIFLNDLQEFLTPSASRRLSLRLFESVNTYILSSQQNILDPMIPYFAPNPHAVRLFVAGDRSSVGKSSVCLGLVGSLRHEHRMAYIKPATQSEAKSLIEDYCEEHSIPCRPIGPLVYYRGFTRAFLQGQTKPTDILLDECAFAVDMVARGRDIVVLDGVGFPAVGSICGTSNVDVALACRANAVLLVGGPGVGAAVDAYNLNASYFAKLPVIGAIFNKLPLTGYYRLEDCREQVTLYFEQYRPQQRAFGFVPNYEPLKYGRDFVDDFVELFQAHVDVNSIIQATKNSQGTVSVDPTPARDQKRRKIIPLPTRDEIEGAAIQSGAAPSA